MIELFKNLVSSESDAKKYHLKSYHEMLEVALVKDYELNPKFLKSIQEEFNISEREHEIIVQMITDSDEKLNSNILDIINNMRYLSEVHNEPKKKEEIRDKEVTKTKKRKKKQKCKQK